MRRVKFFIGSARLRTFLSNKNEAEVLGCTVIASRLFVLPNSKNSLGCLLKPLQKGTIMNKRIKKQFWLSPNETKELKRKAELVGISETAVIRLLIRGFEPREKPDRDFYEAMRQLSNIGNNINQLAVKAHSLGFVDVPMLEKEALRWHQFQADIEATFLRPQQSNLKWK